MSSKRQRANRATRRELWRDDMVNFGLVEKTLGVWRWEKGGIDFYPSKLKAYNYVLREHVDWDIALNMLEEKQMNDNPPENLEQKLAHSEKMRDYTAEYVQRLEEKIRIATEALEFCANTYPMSNLMIVEKALAKIKE